MSQSVEFYCPHLVKRSLRIAIQTCRVVATIGGGKKANVGRAQRYLDGGCSFGGCFDAQRASLWRIAFWETSNLASGWITLSWISSR